MAIEEANQHENSWRLLDTTLCDCEAFMWRNIGLKPHPQGDLWGEKPEIRGWGDLYDISTDERLNHRVEVESGL